MIFFFICVKELPKEKLVKDMNRNIISYTIFISFRGFVKPSKVTNLERSASKSAARDVLFGPGWPEGSPGAAASPALQTPGSARLLVWGIARVVCELHSLNRSLQNYYCNENPFIVGRYCMHFGACISLFFQGITSSWWLALMPIISLSIFQVSRGNGDANAV